MNLFGINGENLCLEDSATTHTILRDKIYFSKLKLAEANVITISGITDLIGGSGRAHIIFLGGTQLVISDALFSSRSQRNLLSFKDICCNGYHIETTNESGT